MKEGSSFTSASEGEASARRALHASRSPLPTAPGRPHPTASGRGAPRPGAGSGTWTLGVASWTCSCSAVPWPALPRVGPGLRGSATGTAGTGEASGSTRAASPRPLPGDRGGAGDKSAASRPATAWRPRPCSRAATKFRRGRGPPATPGKCSTIEPDSLAPW
ncbi:uncharacterized protein LOC110348216 [Heterocephalus glaber]|uniref:Uncharacterized protein LOC110348216 n=1 Tax=Heterocephalus glaber TaxID=10181 RepID=A0AAX6SQ38_HETGA|nr:uncharacterized protein LOC110348216 [Heterocephalus glaber]